MNYAPVQFAINVPCGPDEVGAHIAHARSLGLPMADAAPIKSLTIVANGPSARLFDPNVTAQWHHAQPIDTLAVNGALKLFTDAGTHPTYWAACDAQALVADFLKMHWSGCAFHNEPALPRGECDCGGDAPLPEQTIYLVASKCHPSVFERLKGRDVRLWDINDHPTTKTAPRAVPVASSVTLVSMILMRDAFGYRHFETYGWDACFFGNEHHAGEYLHERPDNLVQLTTGAKFVPPPDLPKWLLERHKFPGREGRYDMAEARTFDTTATWAAETSDAVILTHHATWTVRVHGDGLMRAVLESR